MYASTNKYTIKWQVVRSNAKFIKDTNEKLEYVSNFLQEYNSANNKLRVHNWAEGLKRGYKDFEKKGLCDSFIQALDSIDIDESKKDDALDREYLMKCDVDDLRALYIDLFKRSTKWIQQGYLHEDQTKFQRWIVKERADVAESLKGTRYSSFKFEEMVINMPKKNTYKFIFK